MMINIASARATFRWWRLPVSGIGLTRIEFIITNVMKIHPMALGHNTKMNYFIDQLTMGMAKIAVPQFPNPVIVQFSDFKTNEYADLLGGKTLEPHEANPMLGCRGASRYYDERYREGFALEC